MIRNAWFALNEALLTFVLVLLLFFFQPLAAAEWPVVLHWPKVITLSTPLAGKVESVKVAVGDRVKKGQLLATLDARLQQAEVKRAKSRLTRDKLAWEEAERAFKRARELYDRTVLSTTDFQQAELSHTMALANYHDSQAALAKARVNLEYTKIRAPTDGTITERLIHPGEIVNSRHRVQPILRLAATSQMLARAWLPAKALAGLAAGLPVKLKINQQTIEARIKSIGATHHETQTTTEYAVDMIFTPPADGHLLPGMRGQAIFP